MEAIGYVISNKFIIIAVDARLSFRFGDAPSQNYRINNARKVHLINKRLAVSVIGIPQKITDIYNYILGLKSDEASFHAVIADLESIFNADRQTLIEKILKMSQLVDKNTGSSGVLNEASLAHDLAGDADLTTMLAEAKNLMGAGTGATGVTRVFLFGHENGQNVYGEHIVLGFNMVGVKQPVPPTDFVFYDIRSSIADPKMVEALVAEQRIELIKLLDAGWESSTVRTAEVLQKCKDLLSAAFVKISKLNGPPNVQFYILDENTNFEFKEPDIHLTNISFNR